MELSRLFAPLVCDLGLLTYARRCVCLEAYCCFTAALLLLYCRFPAAIGTDVLRLGRSDIVVKKIKK
jgi:hypothetical protein